MPKPKATGSAPVQTIIIQRPAPVTVMAPDTTEIEALYREQIQPLANFRISNDAEFVDANTKWVAAKEYVNRMSRLFEEACDTAHKAHKALTSLRAALMAPGEQIAAHMQREILRYKAEQDEARRREEARLHALEVERLTREREAEQKRLAEERRLEAERAAAEACPWDDEPTPVIPEPEPVALAPIEVPMVRLASTTPVVMGGPSIAKKPCKAECFNKVKLIIEAGKRAEAGDESLCEYLDFAQVFGNSKARELGDDLASVVPGVRAIREETLRMA